MSAEGPSAKHQAPCAQLALPAAWAAPLSLLDRFEARLRELRLVGLTLWTGSMRSALGKLLAGEQRRRGQAYEQLMLLEHAVQRSGAQDRAGLLIRIGEIKGLLVALMLGLFLYSTLCDDALARGLRSRCRGRRRDECELADFLTTEC